jgi:hypothetical protein
MFGTCGAKRVVPPSKLASFPILAHEGYILLIIFALNNVKAGAFPPVQ